MTGPKRRWLAPEAVQTSTMDCGPAALKCLCEGFGLPISYGRLREACQTDVDGTSIDTLEEIALELGLEAEQIMLPVDHLLVPQAQALPAIVVTAQPSGNTHFVVAWRTHGPLVQLMDPGTGRRWTSARRFLDEVFVYDLLGHLQGRDDGFPLPVVAVLLQRSEEPFGVVAGRDVGVPVESLLVGIRLLLRVADPRSRTLPRHPPPPLPRVLVESSPRCAKPQGRPCVLRRHAKSRAGTFRGREARTCLEIARIYHWAARGGRSAYDPASRIWSD